MVGQHIQGLDIGQGTQIQSKLVKVLVVVRNPGDHHMANPYRHFFFLQIGGEGQNRLLGLTAELLVFRRVDVLDIQEHQAGGGHQAVEFLFKSRGIGVKGDAGGIQAGVDAFLPGGLKEFRHKANLHQGLSAGDGDAAPAVEMSRAPVLGQNLLCGHGGAAFGVPGIRIVAVEAAHGAAA